MLCRSCRRQVARTDEVCGTCGRPLPGRQPPLELVLSDGARVAIAGSLTIGRGPGNTIQLEEQSVSRQHARVLGDGGNPEIEDAGSTYGTFLDGHKITGREPLRDGALIQLGDAELRVEARRDESAAGRTVVVSLGTALQVPVSGPSGLTEAEPGHTLRPRLRAGSAVKRLEADEGDLRNVLRGPDGEFVRMTDGDAELLGLLDGERSIPDLILEANRRFGVEGAGRLASLLADLGERGLLGGVDRAEPAPRRGRLARIFRTRELAWAGAGRVFERAYTGGGYLLFTPAALAVIAAVAVAGAAAFAYLIAGRYGTPFVVGRKVGLGGFVFLGGRFLVVLVHEFAHGLAVASFGRKVPRAGLKLMLIFPYAFVDTSEAYFEPSRRRLAISGAGPLSDLTVGGAAALVAVPLHAGALRDVCFQLALAAYMGALFNLNPLLDRDGYHMVVDLLREPGLRRRSRDWLAGALAGRPTGEVETGIMATYAVTALLWSLATAAFAIIISQRYYGYMTALAPRGVVWAILIVFYVLMFVPILAVFARALVTRRRGGLVRGDSLAGGDGAVA